MKTGKHLPHIIHILMSSLVWVIILSLSADAAARDWFVRPEGGNYGSEDGTSYENAWDGLTNVVWGTGGVVAGDTLYVCGTHINTYDRSVSGLEYNWTPETSGTSENYITIKGHPDHPAIIWNAYIDDRPNGIKPESWTEPDVAGCYYQETGEYNRIYTH